MSKPKPVLVEWNDAVQTIGWAELHAPTDMACKSAGFLVSKTKDRITLALNWDGENYGQHMEIPRSCVTKIRRLK